MSNKLRIGIVGAGWPSWQHMKGYREIPEVELVALCDANEQRLNQIADEYSVPRRYTSYEEMLDAEHLDAVSVCTPNAFHADMSILALRRGLHVHCEKPMAISAAKAQEMTRVSKETGKILMIGFQRRFGSHASFLKQYIDDGNLGEIYFARAVWIRRRGIPGIGGWFTTKSLSGGGALIDIGVHVLDLALWYMGFPTVQSVSASVGSRFGTRMVKDGVLAGGAGAGGTRFQAAPPPGSRLSFDVDDYAFAHVNFGAGRSMMLETSWAGNIKEDRMEVQLWGEKAGARLFPLEIFGEHQGAPVDLTPALPQTVEHHGSTRHFIDVILGRAELICPPEQGAAGIELVERIYNSATS
jgi:predicted dehydrogenase